MGKWAVPLLLLLCLAACAPASSRTVALVADGEARTLATEALTVRELLAEAGITLDEDDYVEPVESAFVEAGMTIRVVRIEVRTETEQVEIPFERRTVREASIPVGETRLLEPGVNGIEELTYRVTVEDGVEIERRLVRRVTLEEPRTEVILVGAQAELTPVPITGTVAYVADRNAWVMQTTSLNQRRLTHESDLDGRVFALSADGAYLLFTRVAPPSVPPGGGEEEGVPPGGGEEGEGVSADRGDEGEGDATDAGDEGEEVAAGEIDEEKEAPAAEGGEGVLVGEGEVAGAPLNSLWMIETTTADAESVQLEAESVLWAGWAPECEGTPTGSVCRIAYTTGSPAEGNPGWKAENDLWIARPRASDGQLLRQQRIVDPNAGGAYGWWGTAYAWAPDGRSLAYARADEVGTVSAYGGAQAALARFAPYRTYAAWVWTPTISWSPEGKFIVTTLHGPAPTGEAPEDSPVFDLWALAANGTVTAELASEVGMWAAPAYVHEGDYIAFGYARSPYASQTSGYDLYLMDRDGSDRRRLFPPAGEIGLEYPEMAWGPGGDQLIVVYQGNLYLIHTADGEVHQLTEEGGVTGVRWRWR